MSKLSFERRLQRPPDRPALRRERTEWINRRQTARMMAHHAAGARAERVAVAKYL